MNFTESFEEFSKGLQTTDLMLYAGIGLVLWILFKDKLSPLQSLIRFGSETIKGLVKYTNKPAVVTQVVSEQKNNAPEVLANILAENTDGKSEDIFFKLVVSWKQTRDLAVRCGCDKAVEVADTMFPYLSPNVCGKESENE